MKRRFFVVFSVVLVMAGVAGSLFVGYRAYEEAKRHERISAEIRLLEEEANRIDQENRKLRDRIEYLQSDSFREQEAKRVLEYQKSGEKVVFIRDRGVMPERTSVLGASSESVPFVVETSQDDVPNPLKWWYEFFGKNKKL